MRYNKTPTDVIGHYWTLFPLKFGKYCPPLRHTAIFLKLRGNNVQ